MSANSSIDGQIDWFFTWCVLPFQSLARHALPASMAAYVYAMELWRRFVVQWNRTYTALIDSFRNEVIYFYEDGNNHFPVVSFLEKKRRLFSGHRTWIYDIQSKEFIQQDALTFDKHKIPYLGASLTYMIPEIQDNSHRNYTMGDLSDWIADQTIVGESNELPLQVMVTAWAYCQNVSLIVGWKHYILTVMNEDGDEVSYSLSEFEDESVASSSSISIASTTEEIQGNIQIIGERILPQSLYDLLVPHAPTNTPLPASPEPVSSDEDEPKKEK